MSRGKKFVLGRASDTSQSDTNCTVGSPGGCSTGIEYSDPGSKMDRKTRQGYIFSRAK